jgi:hypothetical protein
LFDSVHVSAYSLSGHDTPKPFNNTQGELPSRLRSKFINMACLPLLV